MRCPEAREGFRVFCFAGGRLGRSFGANPGLGLWEGRGRGNKNSRRSPLLVLLRGCLFERSFRFVEQQGFEPWSKHGTCVLSTCLVACWFSSAVRKETPKLPLIS